MAKPAKDSNPSSSGGDTGDEVIPKPAKLRLTGPERELRASTLFLSTADGFRLCIASYDNPVRRDYWIDRLRKKLAEEKTHLSILDCTASPEPRLLTDLAEHLQSEPTPADWRRAIAVIGLEPHLPDALAPTGPGRTTNPYLARANLDRDLFLDHCPVPILLWLTPTALGFLGRDAPDLWHWRYHIFDFEEPDRIQEGGQILSIPQIETASGGTIYRNRSEMERAAAVFREGLNTSLRAYGPGHPETCRARENLGNVLQQLGEYQQAHVLFRENLREIEKSPEVAPERLSLALTYFAAALLMLGKYTDAEPLMRRALDIDEQTYGKDHPTVAVDLNNLAQLLQDTNRLAEAEPIMRRALAIDELSYGKDDPNVAIRLNNLALLLKAKNRLAEAEPLMMRSLAINEQSYGKNHPVASGNLNNLATLLHATNRPTEAEPLMRRALIIDEQSYGKDHPKVATSLNNLAQLLKDTNRLSEAEPLMRRAFLILVQFQQQTSYEHPNYQAMLVNYRSLLVDMGWDEEKIDAHLQKLIAEADKAGG